MKATLVKTEENLLDYFKQTYVNAQADERQEATRRECLQAFNELVEDFMSMLKVKTAPQGPRFLLQQFGSALFGAADKSSDLDLLLISYQSVMSRETFAYDFVDHLRSSPHASNVQPVL